MDRIEVEFSETSYDNYDNYDYAEGSRVIPSISLVLNGQPVKGVFDAFAFMQSLLIKQRPIEILTCGCGVAGCAGIFEGTTVKVRRYTVECRDIDCGLPKRFYQFERSEYEAAIELTRKFFIDIATKAESGHYGTEEDYWHDLYTFESVEEFEKSVKRSTDWIKKYNSW